MPGQCEQAVRLIPEEVVQVPAAPPAQATTESAPPTEAAPGQSILEGVPEPVTVRLAFLRIHTRNDYARTDHT